MKPDVVRVLNLVLIITSLPESSRTEPFFRRSEGSRADRYCHSQSTGAATEPSPISKQFQLLLKPLHRQLGSVGGTLAAIGA
jgi:hypothetical protein